MYSYGIGLGFSHDDCVDAIQDVFYRLINSKALEKVDNMRFFLLKCMKNRESFSFPAVLNQNKHVFKNKHIRHYRYRYIIFGRCGELQTKEQHNRLLSANCTANGEALTPKTKAKK
jgi:hypothetical protein